MSRKVGFSVKPRVLILNREQFVMEIPIKRNKMLNV